MRDRIVRIFFIVLAVALLSGCASIVLTERNVSLITATTVKKGAPPQGITNTFTLDSKVYVYGVITWDDTSSSAGYKKFEAKWYRGDRLISQRSLNMNVSGSPFYAWDSMNAIAFGPGEGRVDVYIDGLFVGSRSFKVIGQDDASGSGRFLEITEQGSKGLLAVGEYETPEGCEADRVTLSKHPEAAAAHWALRCGNGEARASLGYVTDVSSMRGAYRVLNYRFATMELCAPFSSAMAKSPAITAAGGYVVFRCHKR